MRGDTPDDKTVTPLLIYVAAIILAASSLLYQLLIAQTLSIFAANTVVWYSVTVGVYLAAMGLGALIHEQFSTDNPWSRLFRVELLLSAMGAIAVPMLNYAHTLGLLLYLNEYYFATNLVFFGVAFLLIAIIGLLTGFELPLLVDLGNAANRGVRVTNRVLASDYMGSLLGGVLFPILLLLQVSLILVGLITAALNCAVALIVLLWLLPKSRRPILRFAAIGSIATSIVLGLMFAKPIDQYFAKNYYFYWEHSDDLKKLFGTLENAEDVFRVRSPYQRIDIVFDERGYNTDFLIDDYTNKYRNNPDQPRNYLLFLNGDFQVTSSYEEFYHEFFAHLPIIRQGVTPQNVLVMGAGDGILIRELVKYPEIERIVHVDLDGKLVALARSHPVLLAINEGALEDDRVETHFDDAYRFIRASDEVFDAIYLDFPAPKDYNVSKLYSREFYHFARKRLAKDGFIVLDAPGLKFNENLRAIFTDTLSAAGFDYVWPYVSKIEDFNRSAMVRLWRMEYEKESAYDIMAEHAHSLRYGFIVARNAPFDKPEYRDPRVNVHILNDWRLQATINNKLPGPPPFDPERVNSIFKPTIPEKDIWDIRDPW